MKEWKLFGLSFPHAISLLTFIAAIISVWVHLEIQIASVNVEIINIKKNMDTYWSDYRKEMDALKVDIKSDTREILKQVNEIQIYLRNK